MLKKIFSILSLGLLSISAAEPFHKPYSKESTNKIYNLLFCDNLDLFKSSVNTTDSKEWNALLSDKPKESELKKVLISKESDSRMKVLAYRQLSKAKFKVPKKELLGVIIEVPTKNGLDVLAAFSDKSARYINYTEKMAIVEGTPNSFEKLTENILKNAKVIVNKIGPWKKARLKPPSQGDIRFTFLCSDGLYFGQGPMSIMASDSMSKPLFESSVALLYKITEKVTE